MAHALFAQGTGVSLSSCGGQGLIESPAAALRTGQAECERQEAAAVAQALTVAAAAAALRVEIAMDGVTAHIDGRWQPPQVATRQGRRRSAPGEEPTLGPVLARRSVRLLGPADDVAMGIIQGRREAGWQPLPRGEILGDGAPWIWNLAEAHVPGGRQTLDSDQLSEPL